MALQIRKVTESQRTNLVLKSGEPLYTTDEKKLYIGDGSTRGGINILNGLSLLEYLDADVEHSPLEDGDVIYWNPANNRWVVGKRYKDLLALEDVSLEDDATTALDKQILMYKDGKWKIVYDISNTFSLHNLQDVEGTLEAVINLDDSTLPTQYASLEYDDSIDKWQVIELPRTPNVGEMQEVTLNGSPELGQMLFIDPTTQQYINNYANQDLAPAYNCGLYQIQNKSIIKFSSSIGKFVNHAPVLSDIQEVSVSGIDTWEPADQVYDVMIYGDNVAFAINNERAHDLVAFKNRKLVFDLSNPSLLNRDLRFSAQPDGTHSLDPVGTTWSSSLVTETGTPGVDGRIEIDIPRYFEDQATSDYWVLTNPGYNPETEDPIYETANGDDLIPLLTFTILGTAPNPLSTGDDDEDEEEELVDDVYVEADLPGLYYFSPQSSEFGAKIQINEPEELADFTLFWDEVAGGFNLRRFDATLGSLADVNIIPDEDGYVFDNQCLAFDSSTQKWTTPLDKVFGLGIADELPREYTEYANMLWAGGVEGLGEFNYSMRPGAELKDVIVNLDDLSLGIPQDEPLDVFLFPNEEDREYFYELLEEATLENIINGGDGVLSRQIFHDLAAQLGAKVMRTRTGKKIFKRDGATKPANSEQTAQAYAQYSAGGSFGGGGGNLGDLAGLASMGGSGLGGSFGGLGGNGKEGGFSYGGDGWTGSDEGQTEPSLDDLIEDDEFPDPQATADAFVEAYKNFGNNVQKVFGVILAKNRALEQFYPRKKNTGESSGSYSGDGSNVSGGGEAVNRFTSDMTIELHMVDVQSDPAPPQMFGWRQSNDTYGYYYFTFSQRNSQLTFNTRDHEIIPHSYMRRVGCTINRQNQFRVQFYYDADDSTKVAGEWLRIVEYQSAQSAYNGIITEIPSTTIRRDLEEWLEGTLYQKGNRVLYNDKVWECLVRTTKGFPPASGTQSAPESINVNGLNEPVNTFVEIPHFSVKSQKFDGVYQMRCTYGSNTSGGFTHPAFRFSEAAGDEADYVYIGANMMSWGTASSFRTDAYYHYYEGTRDQIKTYLDTRFFDNGMYLFDINIHSLLQHLMVSEFQTMNLEKALGEDNGTHSSFSTQDEQEFAIECGNGSGYLPKPKDLPSDPDSGVSCYRGIFKISGSSGYHIDGINVDPSNLETYYQVDNFEYKDDVIKPEGYIDLHPLPTVSYDSSGNGQSFISDFWNFIEADFSDFVYYLPKYAGGNRDAYLGDSIFYREITSSSTPYKLTIGKTQENNTPSIQGAYGPHSLTVSQDPIAAARLIIRRKGSALVPQTQGTGNTIAYGDLYNSQDQILIAEIPEPDPADLAAGDYWVQTGVLQEQQPVVGATSVTGRNNTRTISMERLLKSKSAICIGITDESDSQSAYAFYNNWEDFRQLFPDRTFNMLCPGHTANDCYFTHAAADTTNVDTIITLADLTNPLGVCDVKNSLITIRPKYRQNNGNYTENAMIERAAGLNIHFPNVTDFFPTSENARTSYPLTYKLTRNYLNGTYLDQNSSFFTRYYNYTGDIYTEFLKDYGVMPYNISNQIRARGIISFLQDYSQNWEPSLEGQTFSYLYKIRIPAYTSTTSGQVSDGIIFRYACEGKMTVDVYNPHTDSTINVVTDYSDYATNGETTYTPNQVAGNFSPVDIYNDDQWLEMRITYTNDNNISDNWEDSPALFALAIYIVDKTDSSTDPYEVPIFFTDDYSCPESDLYNSDSNVSEMLHQPLNHALDPHTYGRNYGPFNIGRDNGDTAAGGATDIFELCNLGSVRAGTLIGLFVDRSGSMTQSTIQAAYDLLYQKCAQNSLEIIEVQNSNEDWITPFIQEI